MIQRPALRVLLRELAQHPSNEVHDPMVRLAVRLRARDACEYCLWPTIGQFHIDHIIPPALWHDYVANQLTAVRPITQRRGPEHLDNFAWCCAFCNIAKARQVAHRAGGRTYRLFDPRRDRWPQHFVFAHNYLLIVGLPGIGQATERALGFNDARLGGPLGPRHDAILLGIYPPAWARSWSVGA
ncbi:MAG TPA: HNH endonuclease [Chloroflexota bacterium]